ncbi:hypothetical protein Ancab_023638 [Ancistrocladus abbreviatus]
MFSRKYNDQQLCILEEKSARSDSITFNPLDRYMIWLKQAKQKPDCSQATESSLSSDPEAELQKLRPGW